MTTLNVYTFIDNYVAYFFNNNKISHMVAQPNEVITYNSMFYDNVIYKKLKVTYRRWNKHLRNYIE